MALRFKDHVPTPLAGRAAVEQQAADVSVADADVAKLPRAATTCTNQIGSGQTQDEGSASLSWRSKEPSMTTTNREENGSVGGFGGQRQRPQSGHYHPKETRNNYQRRGPRE